MQRRIFDREAKLVSVRKVLNGQSVKDVALDLKVHENVLRRWIKAYQADGEVAFDKSVPAQTSTEREVAQLRRQVAKLKAERDELAGVIRPASTKTSVTRSMLLDATETIMVEEGYASISTRSVAKKIGVTPALVHYYFPTTDDLLLAAFRRKKEYHDERVRAALGSPNPVRALWKFYTDQERNAIGIEFRAMSNHRKTIRSELAKDIEESRREQVTGLARYLREAGDAEVPSALCVAMIIAGMGRGFVAEEVMGVTYGHAETKAYIEELLQALERLIGVKTDAQTPAEYAGVAD